MCRMLEWHIEIYTVNLLIVTRINIHSKRYILGHINVDTGMKEKFHDKKSWSRYKEIDFDHLTLIRTLSLLITLVKIKLGSQSVTL